MGTARAIARAYSAFAEGGAELGVTPETSDLAEDPAVVLGSLRSLRAEIVDLTAALDESEGRDAQFPHRRRQLKLLRSLGRRLLRAHLEWIEEVEQELAPPTPRPPSAQAGPAV